MSHTPGPWTVGNTVNGINYNANIVYAPSADPRAANGVAQVYGIAMHRGVHELPGVSAVGLANARLIAAAPELLEACKAAVLTLEKLAEQQARPDAWWVADQKKLLAAIAKAES
jgi:hypothetical protein